MKTKSGTRLSSAYAAGLAGLPRPKHIGAKDSAASKEYERGRREAATPPTVKRGEWRTWSGPPANLQNLPKEKP